MNGSENFINNFSTSGYFKSFFLFTLHLVNYLNL